MNRLINPFRYIAGGKALAWGLVVIALETGWLCAIGYMQDTYLHFAPAPGQGALLATALRQVGMWLVPALMLGLCGVLFSRSRIRLIDILGTTALAQAPLLLILLPLSFSGLNRALDETAQALLAGKAGPLSLTTMLLYGLWSLAVLVLFYVRNYQAFSVSCNLRGWRAVVPYIAVVVLVTILSQFVA